jgi:hypothetical protein
MKSHILNGRWIGAFVLIAVALCIMPAAPAQAEDEDPPPGVYLIISLEDKFDLPEDLSDETEKGSETVLVRIGSLIANQAIFDTRYEAAGNVTVTLPKNKKWKKLNGYPYTVLGSFAAPYASVHLVSPVDGTDDEIPRKVQEAFHIASPAFLGDNGEFESQFPTTVEIAQFIYDTATASTDPAPDDSADTMGGWLEKDHTIGNADDPRGPALTPESVLEHIFQTDTGQTIDTTGDVYAEADGDLYPHEPQEGDRLFGFDISIQKKKGDLESNMVIDVEIDIKPGNSANVIEKSENGVVWAAILTTVVTTEHKDENGNFIKAIAFDADDEMDNSWKTVYLGDAKAKDYKIEDANHDGEDDITLKFNVNEIGLTSSTKSLTLTGETDATIPMKIVGSDIVTVKK